MSGQSMIEAEGLVKRFGTTVALDGVDLSVPRGAILGVLGPNGAGKTTAIRILTTLSRPDRGRASVAGFDVAAHPEQVRRRIGVAAQATTLDELLTGRQNLVMIGALSGLRRAEAGRRAGELLERMELSEAADRLTRGYSGGMRRRLDLAASMIMAPPVLFLDEPTTGLDPVSRQAVWEVVRQMVGRGCTVLLTTQYLDEADHLADSIAVFDHGRVIASGTPRQLKSATGSARLEVTLSTPRPEAVLALQPLLDGEAHVSHDGRRIRAAVRSQDGLATAAVRALDRAGILVDDVQVHQPSLDDVFLALTGREVAGEVPAAPLEAGNRVSVRTVAVNATRASGFAPKLRDIRVLVRRNVLHILREPMQLSDVTLQPILFTLLFIFVFGSGIPIPGGSYTDFALAGLLAMNLITSSNGTAVGLTSDLNTGLIDRFRALPMWRPSILIARSVTDLISAAICATIVLCAGLMVGWRPTTGLVSVAAGLGIALLFTYAICWTFGCVGLVARNIEAAMSIGFIVLFPMAFVSNAMVPTQGMPAWLRLIADWNPVSSVTAACRQLFGNPNPSALIHDWPMQNPIAAALLWSAALLLLSVPLAGYLFRRRTAD